METITTLALAGGVLAGRVLVGLLLVVAGAAKITAGPEWFLQTLLGYDLLPRPLAALLARSLPWIEVACGILLVLGLFTRPAAAIGATLLLVFAFAITSAILREKQVDCGCFGQHKATNRPRWVFVYRNLALTGCLLPVYILGGERLSMDAALSLWQAGPDSSAVGALIALWTVACAIAFGLHWLSRTRLAHKPSQPIIPLQGD
jgi:uncharacterized membrane protein YphA (DoxX/SURF4 family)